MHSPLNENDSAGLNVTVWEERQVSKRGKMSHRGNMSQYGKRNIVKHGKNVSEWTFCHNPGKKKVHRFVTATLCPSSGLVHVKSLNVLSGDEM
jgi:hypothetical protein